MISELLTAFFSIFVVMDIFGNIPLFAILLEKYPEHERRKRGNRAILYATGLLLLFLFLGKYVLAFFGISFESFKIAGGLILLIMGITYVLNLKLPHQHSDYYDVAVFPIATPLITGPGVITTIIILTQQLGWIAVLIGSVANLLLTYIGLRNVKWLLKVLGRQGCDVMTRIFGLILTAIAVEYILQGVLAF